MTKKQIKDGNRLITQFMGWELIQTKDELKAWIFRNKTTKDCVFLNDKYSDSMRKRWNKDSVLEFHESWDDLMPVVQKIHSMDESYYFTDLTKYYRWSDKSIVYGAVVEFIKWYNKNGKKSRGK